LLEGNLRGSDHQHAVHDRHEDYLDALAWAKSIGGLPVYQAQSEANLATSRRSLNRIRGLHFLADKKE